MKSTSHPSRLFQPGKTNAMPADLARAQESDERFFARHANRKYRMRLLSRAEIDFIHRGGAYLGPLLAGMSYAILTRQRSIGTRLKLVCQLPDDTDMDAPESICCAIFTAVLTASEIRIEEGSLDKRSVARNPSNKY